jgi:hypothetical protein
LERFVAATLQGAKTAEMDQLVAQYQAKVAEGAVVVRGTAPGPARVASPAPPRKPDGAPAPKTSAAPPPGGVAKSAPAAPQPPGNPSLPLRGRKLEPASPPPSPAEEEKSRKPLFLWGLAAAAVLLFVGGFLFRKGAP